MAAKYKDLVSYFENLSRRHVEIGHNDAEQHFYRFELDEVITGMCGEMNYPALTLEGYDVNYRESESDNIRKARTGAFILIDEIGDSKDFNAIADGYDKLEQIGEDILIKMKADKESRQYPVLREFDITQCEGVPFAPPQKGQVAFRFTFNLVSAVNSEVDSEKWQ